MLSVEYKDMEFLASSQIFQGGVAVKAAEDAGVVAADEEN